MNLAKSENNSNSMSANQISARKQPGSEVPMLNLTPMVKKKNSSPLKEQLLNLKAMPHITGPLPLVFQDFEIHRIPYVNSSRIHKPDSLTDRSHQEQLNEID